VNTSTASAGGGVPAPFTVWQDREVEQGCGEHPGVSADAPGAATHGGVS
jgi:hypothetical protein